MKTLSIYYFVLAAILIGKTATTLYQRSVVVHHGHTVASLQRGRQELSEKQLNITSELAQLNSLTSLENSGIQNEYQSISAPIVISNTQLATSQL